MADPMKTSFVNLWGNKEIRSALLNHIDNTALCALRLVSSECCEHTTEPLFVRTQMTFTPSAFTRASRLEALSRIGHYIQHLTFAMPHTSSTFLPPLINPLSGKEISFLYTPHTTVASVLSRPKYGGDLIGDILTQQYPPIFHAATNVPAFIRSMRCMPNLKHLTISCPGQDPAQRYRRNAVDYALTSLRIAIEHAQLHRLEKLTLDIHPGGLLYLKHMPGFGSTPSAGRRWKQIRKLNITMDSWDFHGPQPGLDHLKILDDYIRSFSTNLEKIRFTWNGFKGPCPLMLYSDPLLAKKKAKLFAEVTSPMSPLPAPPPKPSIKFPRLRYMQVRNATVSAPQVAGFVYEHRHTVREFDFENVVLAKQGTWEEALAPLSRISGNDKWSLPKQGGSTDNTSNIDYHSRVPARGNDDYACYLFEDSEVIDTLEELRRQSRCPAETKVNTKRLKRKRKTRQKNKGALFGELVATPSLPPAMHPANRPRIVPSALFFNPYPPPPPPPMPQRLPSPTTPTPASRFPQLPALQTTLLDSPEFKMSSSQNRQPIEILQPSIYDPFLIPSRTTTRSPSPPRTPPGLSPSASTLTLTPTTSYSSETPITPPHLASPIHFRQDEKIPPPSLMPCQAEPVYYYIDPNIQGPQRNVLAEANRQNISDDAAKRMSVLAKARECVLLRLGKEFGTALKSNKSGGGRIQKKVPEQKDGGGGKGKDGFWGRFYGSIVDRERERDSERGMIRGADDGLFGGVFTDRGVNECCSGCAGGVGAVCAVDEGDRIWDEVVLDRNVIIMDESEGGGDMTGDRGNGRTESVPLMFSRY